MLIKNAPLLAKGKKSSADLKPRAENRRATFEISFAEMERDDAFRIDLDSPECDMNYNLIRQRCFRASGRMTGKLFQVRKKGQIVMVHRTR